MQNLLRLGLLLFAFQAQSAELIRHWQEEATFDGRGSQEVKRRTLALGSGAFSIAVWVHTEAELDDYFATPHPEFAVALIIHWILWGKFDRRIALAYDFGGLVLFAAEPFFR